MKEGELGNLFNKITDFLKQLIKSRYMVLLTVFGFMFFILVIRVFYLQIIKNEDYLNNYVQKSEKTIYTAGNRGIIYDRNGNILAYNDLSYAVTIEDVIDPTSDKDDILNKVIYQTITIIENSGDEITSDFPIILNDDGTLSFAYEEGESKLTTFLCNAYGVNKTDLEAKGYDDSTPQQVYNYLCSEDGYDLTADFTRDEKIKILNVRYNMSLNAYKKYIATTISYNVSDATVAAIYENSEELYGVEVSEKTIRKYNDSMYFSSILGYTGEISEDELDEYNTSDSETEYVAGDIVGKDGIEQVMDTTLFGERGEETVFVNNVGKVIQTVSKTDSVSGNDVYLTIDRDLQIAVYNILEQKIAGILISKIVNYDVVIDDPKDDKLIGIKDVYFQIINNNVVDLTEFDDIDSTENEKNVYYKYVDKRTSAISVVNEHLNNQNSPAISTLSQESQDYLNYVYTLLASSEVGIIDTDEINTDDATYKSWRNGEISLREFIKYALSVNWIDISKIDSEYQYANSDEVYDLLVNKISDLLLEDTGFSKEIYYYLIKNGTVSGSQVCLLLYDQGVLTYDENNIRILNGGGSGAAYNFIIEQIRQLNITPAQIALDPCSGSCTIVDPSNGDVLAMVSYPSYDNNRLSGTIDTAYWKQLTTDQSKPLYSRATQARTAPGSTFKMVTAAAGLEEGILTPSTLISDGITFTKITPSPKCWNTGGHGTLNVSSALAQSCNYFFYEVGWRLSITSDNRYSSQQGLDKIEKYAELLGLTTKTGIEINENTPRYSDENAVLTAIGQGTNNYSGVQLARYAATLANSGTCFDLTLLDKVSDTEGNTILEYQPVIQSEAGFSQTTWDTIHLGMRQVITNGTVTWVFSGVDVEVAGKSGTAQENKLRSNHSVFVSYAPYSSTEPDIATSVLIPFGGSSSNAAEVTRDVMKYYYGITSLDSILNATATTSGGSAVTID